METFAKEMKVIKIHFNVQRHTTLCETLVNGFSSNKFLKEVNLRGVPTEKIEFTKTKLSRIETVSVREDL